MKTTLIRARTAAIAVAGALVIAGAGTTAAAWAGPPADNDRFGSHGRSEASQPISVQTTTGFVYGQTFDGVNAFKGVQYGSAERFEQPAPVTPWEGYRRALQYGEVCPNGATLGSPYEWATPSSGRQVENEVCQFVNVWAPAKSRGAKPVVVFLHGGGFTNGASNELAYYDGSNMAKNQDVVFASLNGRLNVLGFTDLSAYGDAYANSGNAGMADLVLGLEWIRDNIAQFGGDPNNVTIVGQSGGAGKVLALMGMPAAQGLFDKAMAISGGAPGRDQAAARAEASALFAQLGLADGDIEGLKNVPYPDLIAAASAIRMTYGPVVDGAYYPERTVNADGEFSELSRDIPLLMSSTFSEFNTPVIPFETTTSDPTTLPQYRPNTPEPEVRQLLAEKYGADAEAIIAEFRRAYPGHELFDLLHIDPAPGVRDGALATATAKANQQAAPVYVSLFSWVLPVWGGVPAWHTGGDLPFLFDNEEMVDYQIAGDEEGAERVAAAASGMLGGFARTGKVELRGVRSAAFTPDKPYTLQIDKKVEFRLGFDAKLRELIAAAG